LPTYASEKIASADRHDVRALARKALLELLEPLIGFTLDSGLSTHDIHSILREAAVRSVATRQLDVARRVNISGIAASTGIPRAEISRILKATTESSRSSADRHQQSTNKILAVWYQDPKYSTPEGKPADLKIYGRGATFDSLVKAYGRGIPTRAMLDELTRAGAVEVRSSRLIRAKTTVVINRGITPQAIRAFGDRATELLSTMLQNMRDPRNPKFVATISGASIPPAELPLLRKEMAAKGADFLADLRDVLFRETTSLPNKAKRPPDGNRVSVTIFYHEVSQGTSANKAPAKNRRNFPRKS
jgi:hypothetical protein